MYFSVSFLVWCPLPSCCSRQSKEKSPAVNKQNLCANNTHEQENRITIHKHKLYDIIIILLVVLLLLSFFLFFVVVVVCFETQGMSVTKQKKKVRERDHSSDQQKREERRKKERKKERKREKTRVEIAVVCHFSVLSSLSLFLFLCVSSSVSAKGMLVPLLPSSSCTEERRGGGRILTTIIICMIIFIIHYLPVGVSGQGEVINTCPGSMYINTQSSCYMEVITTYSYTDYLHLTSNNGYSNIQGKERKNE